MEPAESSESFATSFIMAYHKAESFAESSSVEICSPITPFSKFVRVFISALNNTLIDVGVANMFMFAGNPITSVSSLTKLIPLFKSTACQNTYGDRQDRLATQQKQDLTTAVPEVTTPTANLWQLAKPQQFQLAKPLSPNSTHHVHMVVLAKAKEHGEDLVHMEQQLVVPQWDVALGGVGTQYSNSLSESNVMPVEAMV
ncbi:hypothetical protein DFJ73DRAFT_891662 [Zopfochytrium polystomum]|nr:hypothetical protein DFJ73DRAFT_891662 [Zopfochytrium polystomum]